MKTILIADDEPHVMRVLRLCLEREGYKVETVLDGKAALAAIRQSPPDVLITDIQMPGMNGRELCQAIHAEMPSREFLILVMTSMTARENREWAGRIPATEFLEKPLSPRNLISRLKQRFEPVAEAA